MFGRFLFIIVLLFVAALTLLAVLVVDGSPKVSRVSSQQVDNAETVHALLRQLKNGLEDRHSQQRVEEQSALRATARPSGRRARPSSSRGHTHRVPLGRGPVACLASAPARHRRWLLSVLGRPSRCSQSAVGLESPCATEASQAKRRPPISEAAHSLRP